MFHIDGSADEGGKGGHIFTTLSTTNIIWRTLPEAGRDVPFWGPQVVVLALLHLTPRFGVGRAGGGLGSVGADGR